MFFNIFISSKYKPKIFSRKKQELRYAANEFYLTQDGQYDEIPPKLLSNQSFVLKALQQGHPRIIDLISPTLLEDEHFVLKTIELGGTMPRHVSKTLRNNKCFMLQALQLCSAAYYYASDELKNDREFALAAVKRYGLESMEFRFIDPAVKSLLKDAQFLEQAKELDPEHADVLIRLVDQE
ncbi:hypothetical protein C9374_010984 [Naegleria lovaniensis]|uniref:DUF4116 domain-containing protein n=1 Tax=Naegleria lovaniensis TaxID=51637 RepID=A0AA88GA93_NAELO|nr:uncharacterized protein C9374_010984 [Naegleria lovaniensis]KAG2374147.1 hypothetical protein C9374_010984 [Naegleria lovaniensis]